MTTKNDMPTKKDDYAIGVEQAAILLKEEETDVFRKMVELCAHAIPLGYGPILATTWGCSTYKVRTYARIGQTFPLDLILPHIPFGLYAAALDTDAPTEWLIKAIDAGWSSRQLRDEAGIAKGKHISDICFEGPVRVTAWDVEHQVVSIEGLPISGEKPDKAEVTLQEVLQ